MKILKMRRLITTKPHKYGTRHLTAGEEYEAPARHAVALVAAKRARFVDKPDRTRKAKLESMVEERTAATANIELAAEPVAAEATTIDRLRLQATQLGIDVDGRWGVARLQHEIAQARR